MTRGKLLLVLGLLLLYELLVWGAALLFLTDTNRLLFGTVLTVCGLTVVLTYILVSRAVRRDSPQPASDAASVAAPSPAPPAGANEDEGVLESLIAEANGRLARSPAMASQRIQTTINRLPLYLLLGSQGTGKTSTFMAADLSAELLAGEAARGSAIAPTRLCNLWFAGGALVVDLSGRFSGESNSRFPSLLRHFRRSASQPRLLKFIAGSQSENLQGVFLCVDVDDFLGLPDGNRQSALARRCQERMREVGEAFQIDFPVYVIFTKCDRIPFFGDYFARLNANEDGQILGCTLPALAAADRPAHEDYSVSESRRVTAAYNNLYYSLADKRMRFLQRESDRAQRPMVYEFPRELKRIRGSIVQFLVDVFRPNPLHPGPMLRGFYLTGVRQVSLAGDDGTAWQKDRESRQFGEATRLFDQRELLRAAEGVELRAGQSSGLATRWSFVSELFNQSITRDRGTAGAGYVNRQQEFFRRVSLVAVCSLALVFAALAFGSWLKNRSLLREVEAAAAACEPLRPEAHGIAPSRNLQAIDRLRKQLTSLIDYRENGAPSGMRFGLYSGNAVLPAARRIYFDRFRNYFLDRVLGETSTKLAGLRPSENPPFSYETVYNDLKSYRTITVSSENSCKPDAPFAQWLLDANRQGREMDADSVARLRRNIDFYSRELARKELPFSIEGKQEAVATGRDYLKQFGGEQRVYRAIIEEVNRSSGKGVRLADYAPKAPEVLTGPQEVEAAFSLPGRDKVLERIKDVNEGVMGEGCVLGTTRMQSARQLLQGAALEAKLRNLFVRDYVRKWRAFLEQSRVVGYRNTGDAARKLSVLQENDSPLLGMLFMASENTTFAPSGKRPGTPGALSETAPAAIDRFSYRFGRAGRAAQSARNAARDVKLPASNQEPELSTDDITRTFQSVHELFGPGATRDRWTGDKNRNYLMALTEMQRSMDALAHSSSPEADVPLNNAADKAMKDGADRVKLLSETFIRNSENVPETAKRLLIEPFESARPYVVIDFSKPVREKLDSGMRTVCAKLAPLLRKYPFNPLSATDATLEEVSAVFAPQTGALWVFYQKSLAAVLVKQGHRYVVKPDAPPDTKISPEFLAEFNRLAQITDALYPEGEPQPRMRYRLRTLPNQNFKSMTLTVGGESMSGGERVFTWPSLGGSQDLRFTARTGDVEVAFASYPGLWSVFRMMADADPRPSGANLIGLTNLSHGSSRPEPVRDREGNPITVRIEVLEFPGGVTTSFDRTFFSHLHCPARVSGL